MLLALLLLLAQDTVDDWLDKLDASDIALRAEAEEELFVLGEKALEPIKAYIKDPPSKEAGARASELLKRIEKRIYRDSFKAGKAVGGLQARLIPEQKKWRVGGDMMFTLEIRNASKEARKFLPVMRMDYEAPGIKRTFAGTQARLFMTFTEGKTWMTPVATGGPVKEMPKEITLKPGGTWEMKFNLRDYRRLPHGGFDVRLHYYGKQIEGAKADLVTNVVQIEVD